MHLLSFEEFKKQARPGTRVPVCKELMVDDETPVSLYSRFLREKFSFLLESVQGGEKWGQYSFIGLKPSVVFRSRGEEIVILKNGRKQKFSFRKTVKQKDALVFLEKELHAYRYRGPKELARFTSGAVGFVSYDMVRHFEKLPDRTEDPLQIPDLYFMIPSVLLIVDNLRNTLNIVCDVCVDQGSSPEKLYQKALQEIRRVERCLSSPHLLPRAVSTKVSAIKKEWKLSLDDAQYSEAVERVRDYILAGDVTQVVPSTRFETRLDLDSFALYRAIRHINPSPYLFHLKFEGLQLVGGSPEVMVRLEKDEITVRPIAGTRRRGRTVEEDHDMEQELLNDPKERAEHVMLVDLGRNDVGRVSEKGTVRVDQLMVIERYSHVMHIVSNVKGKIAPGKDMFDVLRATFPAGTLSGSPKIRAMEIIEELEPVRRGVYGGCVGYFGCSGNMDMAITIRSALLYQGSVFLQAGGGIVADSDPKLECLERRNKARAMMEAVDLARSLDSSTKTGRTS